MGGFNVIKYNSVINIVFSMQVWTFSHCIQPLLSFAMCISCLQPIQVFLFFFIISAQVITATTVSAGPLTLHLVCCRSSETMKYKCLCLAVVRHSTAGNVKRSGAFCVRLAVAQLKFLAKSGHSELMWMCLSQVWKTLLNKSLSVAH